MTTDQLLDLWKDFGAVVTAFGVIAGALSHMPFSPKWAERFARFSVWTSQKFSVNRRDTLPAKDEGK